MLMIIFNIIAILDITFAHVAPAKFRDMCPENKKLTGCILSSLIVKSKLSCFKECHILNQCKSVNLLHEYMKRYQCEVNSCIADDCTDLDDTPEKYNYFYKLGTGKLWCFSA